LDAVRFSAEGDQSSDKDQIGFAPYAEAIADFLSHPGTQPPLTLSIEGEWGAGKSSFMLQVADLLPETKEA
jgi:predicted KAP-like P-loop ATPase